MLKYKSFLQFNGHLLDDTIITIVSFKEIKITKKVKIKIEIIFADNVYISAELFNPNCISMKNKYSSCIQLSNYSDDYPNLSISLSQFLSLFSRLSTPQPPTRDAPYVMHQIPALSFLHRQINLAQ